jgi:hypothetical protein
VPAGQLESCRLQLGGGVRWNEGRAQHCADSAAPRQQHRFRCQLRRSWRPGIQSGLVSAAAPAARRAWPGWSALP